MKKIEIWTELWIWRIVTTLARMNAIRCPVCTHIHSVKHGRKEVVFYMNAPTCSLTIRQSVKSKQTVVYCVFWHLLIMSRITSFQCWSLFTTTLRSPGGSNAVAGVWLVYVQQNAPAIKRMQPVYPLLHLTPLSPIYWTVPRQVMLYFLPWTKKNLLYV